MEVWLSTKYLLFSLQCQTFVVRLWFDTKKALKKPFVVFFFVEMSSPWADHSRHWNNAKRFDLCLMVVAPLNCWWIIWTCSKDHQNGSIIVTEHGKMVLTHKTRCQVLRRDSQIQALTHLVSRGWIMSVGRSYGKRREQQMSVRSVHQTIAPAEHYHHVFVSGHVPTQ